MLWEGKTPDGRIGDAEGMLELLWLVLTTVLAWARPRHELVAENLRVNVNFSEQAYRTLESLARQTGTSMSDVLRDAIAPKAWFEATINAYAAGGGAEVEERRDGRRGSAPHRHYRHRPRCLVLLRTVRVPGRASLRGGRNAPDPEQSHRRLS